nr:hypothetical protein [Tanacetum cinerariifolium]
MDVAQVANAARNYEILYERDDQESERPDKRQRSGDRHQQTSQQSSHRSHGQNNDRHGSDRRGGNDNHRGSNNNNDYSGNNKLNFFLSLCSCQLFMNMILVPRYDNKNFRTPVMDVTKGTGVISPTDLPILQSRGPSEGYFYPVCTTCGRRHQGECRRAAGTCFKCGQAGHLQKDCRKNTTTSTSGQADKKPGGSGHVFAITEGQAANTS